MANIEHLVAIIHRWEGGFSNDPADSGGPTNRGVTLKTWEKTGHDKNGDGLINVTDLTQITHKEMVEVVLRPHYWDVWQADKIKNQAVANMLVDWMWTSGTKTISMVQKILKVKVDGVVGKQTLRALNDFPDQKLLFNKIKTLRINYTHRICQQNPKNLSFKRGWLNRIADIRFLPVLIMMVLLLNFTACRTAANHTSQETADKVEDNVTEQKTTTDYRQSQSVDFTQLETIMCIDSITETAIIAFKLFSTGDSGKVTGPMQTTGKAIITRNRKVLTAVHRNRQEAECTTKHDSSGMQSATVESVQHPSDNNPTNLTANRVKSALTLMIVAVLGLWIYYVYRSKKLN